MCSVGVARDRGDRPEASSSRQFRGEETRYTIMEIVLIFNVFEIDFGLEHKTCLLKLIWKWITDMCMIMQMC